MKATLNLLYKSFFAVFLLFAVYGCQTTDSTVSSGPSFSELDSSKTESGAEYVEHAAQHTSAVEKVTTAASVTTTDEASEIARKKKEIMEKFGNNFIGRLKGHGGAMPPDVSAKKETVNRDNLIDDLAAKPADTENRPYIKMEKQLYGKWINKLKTESYDFYDDGTVTIVVSGQRGKTHTLHGNYRIVGAKRIKIDFRNDSMASQMPPRYFKISISDNAFSLTDEPNEKDGLDGPTTEYYRVK